MTDKDPKDMTASELLRQSDSNPCSMCHLVLAGDESCATTGCAEWAYRLADKIDAELAEARKDAIRESKKPMWWFRNAIKRGEDWPEPRDGETEYWRCVGFFCGDCPAEIDGKRPSDRYGVLNCSIAQGMDIARRQADLDARKGGE